MIMSKIFWIELIGYIGGVLTLVNMLPQILKTYRLKSAEDISVSMITLYGLSMIFWTAYAYFIHNLPLLISCSVSLILTVVQACFMVRYSNKKMCK